MLDSFMLAKKKAAPGIVGETQMPMTGMPSPTYNGSCCIFGDYLYTFGGRDSTSTYIADTYRFHRVNHTWEKMANAPVALAFARTFPVSDRIWVTGNSFTGYYDPTTNTWTNLGVAAIQYADLGYSAGSLYSAGGLSGGKVNTVQVLTETPAWANDSIIATAMQQPAAGQVGDELILAGGINSSNARIATVQAHNLVTKTNRTIATMKVGTVNSIGYGGSGAVRNGKMYCIGGTDTGASSLSAVFEIDPVLNIATKVFDLSVTCRFGCAAGAEEGIYLFGGQAGNTLRTTLVLLS